MVLTLCNSALFVLLLSFSPLLSVSAKEYVLTLDHNNFDTEIQKHDFMLVEFYAPWCGHCKSLAPEYEKAAKALNKEGSAIVLAKVNADAAENKPLAQKYGVQGFPTLKIFRKDSGVQDYDGPREADGIVKAVKKQAGPPSRELLTAEDVKEFLADSPVAVVGLFNDFSSKEFENFMSVAKALRTGLSFAHTKNSSILPEKSAPLVAPVVRLYKDFDEGFNDFTVFDIEPLKESLETKSLPLVAEMSRDESAMRALSKIFESEKTKALLFLDYTSPDKKAYADAYSAVASGKTAINFIIGDGKENDHALKYFGATMEDTPVLLIHDTAEEKKYVKPKVKISEIGPYLDDYENGALEAVVKSQPIPEDNDEPVKVVVGKNFDDVVFKSGKNVLIEFYAPWCGHCKKLAPIFDKVGEEFEDDEDVIIAKFDADSNDIPNKKFTVKGFPTLFFVNSQGEVSSYEGGRKKNDMVAFVKANKTKPSLLNSAKETVEEAAEAVEATLEKVGESVKAAVEGGKNEL